MRTLLIIATIVVLSAAKPGGYHHQHYQFEQSSAAYRNNDLQHKHDEAGRYTKFEDLDSSDEPQENMNYHRTEYNAAPSAVAAAGVKGSRRVWKPTTNRDLFAEEHPDSQSIATNITPAAGSQVQEESQTPTTSQSSSGSTSFDDNHPHFRGHSGRYHGYHSGGQSGYFGHDHSADFHRSHHGEGFQRGYHSHHTGQHHGAGYGGHSQDASTTSEPEVLQPIEDDDTIYNYDKFKQYGFGKEYLDNTEGATNNANSQIIGSGSSTNNENPGLTTSNIGKPVDRAIGISSAAAATSGITTSNIEITKPDQGSLFVSPTSPSNQNTAAQGSELTTNTATNIGLATSFADSGNRGNSQIGQQNVKPVYEAPESEIISQSAVATASEDDLMKIFAKIDQIAKDMGETQQRETQHGMAGTQTLDQYGRNQLDARRGTQQDISDIRTAQTFHSTQQQMQFGSQDFTQQSAVQFNQGQQKDLTQQTQVDDLIEKTDENSGQLEAASQIRADQHNDMTQQTQDGFGTLEFGSQHQADLTQQTQDGFSKLTQDGFDKLEFSSQNQQSQDMIQQSEIDSVAQQISGQHSQQQNRDVLNVEYHQTGQHTQDGFGKLEMGSLRTQQTQDESSKLKHGGQEGQEDLTQQTQDDAFGRHQDLTQQTQDEFGKLEFAGQEDVIQQEDLTQQTQDGFGKLEFAGQEDDLTQQTQQEQLTQQTQDGFGKLEFAGQEDLTQQTQQEDLTQQTQDEFGKLEFAGHEDLTQQADLTQQTQDEFGKLEFDQHRQREDLTQHTQDGFGKLEIASQHHETQYGQHQSQYSRSHSYSTNYNYGEQRTIAAETTQDLAQQQKAHETLDVTQQVKNDGDLILDEQKESDLNQMSSHDLDETLAEEEPTVKPGFWKRVGSSISKTYEKAKVSLG